MSSVLYVPDLENNSSCLPVSLPVRVQSHTDMPSRFTYFLLCYTFRSCDHYGVEAGSEVLRKFSLFSLIDEKCFYAFCQCLAHEL